RLPPFFLLLRLLPPASPLFPYTTLSDLVALAAFLGMVYALGARARLFEAHYTIHAEFTEVAGLTEGATVRLAGVQIGRVTDVHLDRKSTRLNSSHDQISYAVFCLKKKKI